MDETAQLVLHKILKDNGHSITAARTFVCQLMWQREPQSMRELSQAAAGTIDRASLYRTIGLFERLGLVQRIYIGWKYKVELSDIFSHHHHHISCLGCGKIVAITEEAPIEALIRQLAAEQGFATDSHQLEIRGYCPVCRQSGKRSMISA